MARKAQKVKVQATVKVRAWPILEEAVERGVGYGFMRAHKHVTKPSEDAIKDAIQQAVMSELSEIFDFGD